ncbi:MAG: choice-of-anchor M domain-containing protein [Opitutales bacterium]|nr:choice-of-anchor M domain-containing protein [Opitutales bacterium]
MKPRSLRGILFMHHQKWTFVLLFLTFVTATQSSGDVAGRLVMGQGHLDMDFDYTAEAGWVLRHRHEDKGIRSFGEGLIFVRDGAFPAEGSRITRPEDGQWAFLGVAAGEPFWFLPASERDGIVWPGMAAEHTDLSLLAAWEAGDPRRTAQATRWIAVDLVGVRFTGEGTGHLAMWVTDIGGAPLVFWSTAAPHPAGNRYLMAAGSHNHMAWAFSAPGVYEVDVRASTVLADGTVSESAVDTLVFVVGATPDPLRYQEWAALRFSAQERDAGKADPAADPMGTGVPNLLAFASGGEPGASPASITPRLEVADNRVALAFTRRADLGDTILRLMRSSDLAVWTEVAHTTGPNPWTLLETEATVGESSLGEGLRRVEVSLPNDPTVFIRLEAHF